LIKLFKKILTLKFLEDRRSLERKDYISRERTKIVFFLIFVFFFVWILILNIGQMMLIGTVRGHNLSELADKKYKIDSSLQPNRGKIYDRNGNILADNIESYKLVAVVSDKATEDETNPRHVGDINKKTYEYIKKYLRLEASDLFFADAVILVEGLSEETYLRYEIDNHHILKNHHVKIYRIDGAHSHKFIKLLELLGLKTIIFTDLDLKRKNKNKNGKIIKKLSINISDLSTQYANPTECLSTNKAIQYFVRKEISNEKATYTTINPQLIKKLTNKEELSINYNNITLYSQGKINGYYATSFEEAIILTNAVDEDKKGYQQSLIKLLKYVHPKKKGLANIKECFKIAEKSYMYQVDLSNEKSKFSTGIVYLSITDREFNLKLPKYIESGLNSLCKYFEEGMSNDVYN